jgi:hypothetical protein
MLTVLLSEPPRSHAINTVRSDTNVSRSWKSSKCMSHYRLRKMRVSPQIGSIVHQKLGDHGGMARAQLLSELWFCSPGPKTKLQNTLCLDGWATSILDLLRRASRADLLLLGCVGAVSNSPVLSEQRFGVNSWIDPWIDKWIDSNTRSYTRAVSTTPMASN